MLALCAGGLLALATSTAAPPPPACAGDSNGAYNDSMTFSAFPAPNLVPWPLKIELEDGYFYINASTVIALSGSTSTGRPRHFSCAPAYVISDSPYKTNMVWGEGGDGNEDTALLLLGTSTPDIIANLTAAGNLLASEIALATGG